MNPVNVSFCGPSFWRLHWLALNLLHIFCQTYVQTKHFTCHFVYFKVFVTAVGSLVPGLLMDPLGLKQGVL